MIDARKNEGKAKVKLQMRTMAEMDEGTETFDTAFERAYERMMEKAIGESRGERKRRLMEKHGYLEKLFAAKVWWPAIGNLEHLHPEYERRDLRDSERFSDYAYLPSKAFGLLIEADGYGPHWRNVSRWKFDDDLERQNLLLIEDWRLLRFSSDGIKEKPMRCQQTLLLALGKRGQAVGGNNVNLNVYERAILHYSQSFGEERMTAGRVADALGINKKTAIQALNSLAEKGYFASVKSPTGKRMSYTLATSRARRL